MKKWVSTWGNAMSFSKVVPAEYAKDITLRYSVISMFEGDKVRLSFDNFTGKEPVCIHETTVDLNGTFFDVTFDGKKELVLQPGEQKYSDEVHLNVKKGDVLLISYYLKDFTSLRCGVYTQGPYSKAQFAWGNEVHTHEINHYTSKKTNWVYFLNQVDVFTEEKERCVILYGDSITAQDWPDYVKKSLLGAEDHLSVIRRAVSGTRVLREYDCLTYLAYGLKGEHRFDHEMVAAGADAVLIFQGINDIIHPVGVENNEYRPWSDLPTLKELTDGLQWYIDQAHEKGLKVYMCTLLPIEGWRTYADFREELRQGVNEWIRQCGEVVVDFDLALRDEEDIHRMKPEFDSGDHLHPSTLGYQRMGEEAYRVLTK